MNYLLCKFRSLRCRLIISAVAVESVMLSFLVWNNMRLMEQYLTDDLEYHVQEIKPLINASIAGPLFQEDLAVLSEFTRQFHTEEIRYIAIYNAYGERLIEAGEFQQRQSIPAAESELTLQMPLEDDIYFIRMPIYIKNQKIGYVEMSLDTSAVTEAIGTAKQQGVSIALSEVALSIVLLSIMGVALTAQLQHLTHAAKAMAEGDLSVRVPVKSQDEVGEAAETFNLMAQRISATQESLRESQSRTRLLLDSTGEAIYGMDLSGNCTFVNPACVRLLGYDHEDQVLGQNMHALIHHSHPDGTPYPVEERGTYQAHLLGEHVRTDDEVLWRKDGSKFPVEYCSYPIRPDGKVIGSVVTFSDISERKMAEMEIRQLNEKLEARVEARTAELKGANRQLEASFQELKHTQKQLVQSEKMASLGNLVAGVAHEINTPVGIGVTAASHLEHKLKRYNALYADGALTRDDLESLMKGANEATGLILSNLHRAADLVRSFKQVAVDQSSSVERSVDIGTYLGEILKSLHPELKKTRHTVTVNCPEQFAINSNPGALSQIITNLVMNSLTHGFDGIDKGEIHIDAGEANGELVLAYSDNGKGIPPDNVKKIFEPFFTTKRGSGGSGLGMHIVYNLVTQTLDGRIECNSTPGKGTRFDVRVPIKQEVLKAVAL